MSKGAGLHPKAKSKIQSDTRLTLFGAPQLLEGEDLAAYDELLGRAYAAVKPVDVIDHRRNVHSRRRVLGMGSLALAPLKVEFAANARA